MATVRDIAAIVGASAASVSRVLSGDPTFKTTPGLRSAILEAAEKLGYASPRRRASAKGAEARSCKSVAIASRWLDQSMFSDGHMSMIRSGIEQRIAELKLSIVDVSIEELIDRRLSSCIIAAIIIGGLSEDEADRAASIKLPIVIVDWRQNDDRFDCIYARSSKSVSTAIDSLKTEGHTDIRYVGSQVLDLENRLSSTLDRFRAYQKASGDRAPPMNRSLAQAPNPSRFQSGYQLVADIIRSGERLDALVAEDDDFAIGAYRALREVGLRPGADVAVLSLCRTPSGTCQSPPVVSIDGRGAELGRESVDIVVSRTEGRTISRDVVLSSKVLHPARNPNSA